MFFILKENVLKVKLNWLMFVMKNVFVFLWLFAFFVVLNNSYTKINTNGARKDKSVGIS